MARYDPNLVGELASSLDDEAGRAPLLHAAVGAVLGGSLLGLLAGGFATGDLLRAGIATAAGLLLGGVLGGALGAGRAASLRMQAQAVLCQMQIERNTRKEKPVSAESAPVTASSVRPQAPAMQKAVLSRPPIQKTG